MNVNGNGRRLELEAPAEAQQRELYIDGSGAVGASSSSSSSSNSDSTDEGVVDVGSLSYADGAGALAFVSDWLNEDGRKRRTAGVDHKGRRLRVVNTDTTDL